jgi:hypothetical protein
MARARVPTKTSSALQLRKYEGVSGGLFTLGAALARVWQPAYPLLPWALTSALLSVAGLWDYWTGRGPIEWIVVGLGAYELMIGLLTAAAPAGRAARASQWSKAEPDRRGR